jgi:hypothetical protein
MAVSVMRGCVQERLLMLVDHAVQHAVLGGAGAALGAGAPAIVEIPIDPDELPAPATQARRITSMRVGAPRELTIS